jgi:hypothetical protein
MDQKNFIGMEIKPLPGTTIVNLNQIAMYNVQRAELMFAGSDKWWKIGEADIQAFADLMKKRAEYPSGESCDKEREQNRR